ncbi:Diacylglycerol O-acyltransferase 2 [Phytophthora cinnamomi]|uniref:Diacylglycerol O-acyltransferase 2 n=1 Tax=Phytophthora cinnamomi TaxID=4785 RepID=UPI003559502C|nr:Diacylglycerol O-acyltransferase 2 [Phytophthora cinnamomi]
MALALIAHGAASEVSVCSLPSNALYVLEDSALVPCAASGSSTLSTKCQAACSCRRLENDKNVYGVCINSSATFDCDAASNSTDCARAPSSTYLGAGSASTAGANIAGELASSNGSGGGGLKAWEWALIGLAVAFVVGLLVFFYNWFKHRPQRGDNRREVVQSLELSRSQPKDGVNNVLPVTMRESQARTATSNRESAARTTTRSHETNPSQISGFSGGSYHTYAGNPMSSTLTDTEIVTQHQERAFSPISDASRSVGSSEYSQGVDTTTTPNTALLAASREQGDSADSDDQAYPSFSSYSVSSGMDSFSSELSVEGGSDMETGERAPYPRKKSIEF